MSATPPSRTSEPPQLGGVIDEHPDSGEGVAVTAGEADEAAAPGAAAPDQRRPRRYGTVALALAVAVGLLLGYSAGLLTPSLRKPGDTSVEAGFARDMKTHHAQAVEMAMIVYQRTSNPVIRDLGFDIALTQQNQIGQMDAWLRNWGLDPTGPEPAMAWMPEGTKALVDGRMPGMATDAQLTQLRQATGRNVDVLFLQLMIPHHLGGIHMADGALAESDNAEVRHLASAIKEGQQYEITVLRNLQTQLGVS